MTRRQKAMISIIGEILLKKKWILNCKKEQAEFKKDDLTIVFYQDIIHIYNESELLGTCDYGLRFYDNFWDMVNSVVKNKK